MPEAWKTPRRGIVAPAEPTHSNHASLRARRATSWSTTATASNHSGVLSSACRKVPRRAKMVTASATKQISGTPMVSLPVRTLPTPAPRGGSGEDGRIELDGDGLSDLKGSSCGPPTGGSALQGKTIQRSVRRHT